MNNHAVAGQTNSRTLAPQPAGLVFIQIKRPNDTKKKDVRKQVRSHIARQQHKRARELTQQRSGLRELSPLAPRESDCLRDANTHAFDFANGKPNSSNASRTTSVHQDDNDTTIDEGDAADLDALMTMKLVAQNPLAKGFSQGTAAFQTFALHDPANTAGIALANLGLHTSSVVGFYDHLVLSQAGDIQTQFKTGLKASAAHKRFMTFIFSDPMLLIMAILVSIANILGDLSATTSHGHVLQLYSFLIQSINTALNDSERSLSDEMLVCISLFAAYEVKHGTSEN
ncbi:hypothetical protein Slin14017_G052470 [Septoria linicola]|nr:hypothetical protein Slin14017_G052470 [Septoria linicola]